MKSLVRRLAKDTLQNLVFPGRFLWRLPGPERRVALTFDDGPHPVHTPAMLALLRSLGIQATFFVVGREVERFPAIARRIVDEGHAIAGHSHDHVVITGRPPAELRADLQRCRAAIQQATGCSSALFRPPKGEVSLPSLRTVCGAGFTLVHWTRTCSDYLQDGTAPLLARIQAQPLTPGDILLFHDQNPFTVQALTTQLPKWQAQGWQFQALDPTGAVRPPPDPRGTPDPR